MDYTVEVYKLDRRTKSGERLEHKVDYPAHDYTKLYMGVHILWPVSKGYRVAIHETFVTRKNLLSGEEFTERYDTPVFCSPSSESYWSM
jgi:hypothetical protein